ncbi:MAG: ribulose-phosphate 3-epimerase [Roseburia sp.]|nr:ribulose-phosphate 3-epimerase [Roseburia sp.]MCM1278526.1 ribulose-phosphate 3-epimerase [Robinsoniella sp.]
MLILAPSILSADFTRLGEQIQAVEKVGARYIHIDVMDGIFVPSISFGMPVIQSIRPCTDCVFDVHLMIDRPERYIEEFVKAGADIITFHVEACDCVKETIEKIRGYGKKAGISLNPDTPISAIEPYLALVDLILVMSVNPGFGGQKYIEGSTEKIAQLRKLVDERKLGAVISVDGGIKKENVQKVLVAGADVVVAGSAVFHGDVEGNAEYFMRQLEEFGE